MNSLLLAIILIPALEIYLFIKIGAIVGAFNTILLIFCTAFVGIYYARAEGLNTLNQGLKKMIKEQLPIYELLSGALIGIGAILLIIPGFATDVVGFLIIFPPTRKILFKKFKKKQSPKNYVKDDLIEGDAEDIDEKK